MGAESAQSSQDKPTAETTDVNVHILPAMHTMVERVAKPGAPGQPAREPQRRPGRLGQRRVGGTAGAGRPHSLKDPEKEATMTVWNTHVVEPQRPCWNSRGLR